MREQTIEKTTSEGTSGADTQKGDTQAAAQQHRPTVSVADLNKSISILETLRGQLMTRKIQEEQRLLTFRERMRKRQEVEARRAGSAPER